MICKVNTTVIPSDELRLRVDQLEKLHLAYIDSPEFSNLSENDVVNTCPKSVYGDNKQSSTNSTAGLMESALLTPEGERWLFLSMNYNKMRVNQWIEEMKSTRHLSKFIDQIEHGLQVVEQNRAAIVEANTRLVASIAHKYSNSRMDYDELVSEGNMILVNAVDKFDYTRGFRFSTYATHAVQRHFFRCLQKKQRRKSLEVSTPTEVLSEITPNRHQEVPLDHTVAEALIARFAECLDDREAVIIRERFGLNDSNSAETLKVIADRVGLSKERVRQLQMRAIEKLQDLAIQMKLKLDPAF